MNRKLTTNLLCLLLGIACIFCARASEEDEMDYSTDLTLETIRSTMQREKEISPKLMPLLDAQRARAAASLDELERKYEELRLATFYQGLSNFFHLAHTCSEIAKLHTRSLSDNFPITRTRVRIGMAIQRYAFLAQCMREINTAKLTQQEKQQLKQALSDCDTMERDYKKLYDVMLKDEERFSKLSEKIRKLDIYANGAEVGRYARLSADRKPVDLKKVVDFREKQKSKQEQDNNDKKNAKEDTPSTLEKAQQLSKEDADTDKRRADFMARAVEEAKAYGTDIDLTEKLTLESEQQVEGRLAARIGMCLWEPSRLHRDSDIPVSFLDSWGYLLKSVYKTYIAPEDATAAHAMGRAGLFFLVLLAVASLLSHGVWQYCKWRMDRRISRKRLRAAMLPLTCAITGLGLFIYGQFAHPTYLGNHVAGMGEFLLISAVMFGSMVVYLNSRRVLGGIRLFEPLFVTNFFCILYCVLMCSNYMLAMTAHLVFAIGAVWMLVRFLNHIRNLRIAARVHAVLSIIILTTGAVLCYRGYYYVFILIELSWYVLMANFMFMTALNKLTLLACRRVAASKRLKHFHTYINAWLRLVVSHMLKPLIFLLLIWYGLRWSTECFDLAHFLQSWMSVPHQFDGFIRTISGNDIMLIITVGICINCFIQVLRQTVAMMYGEDADAGRSQTLITLFALLLWGGFIIFALNVLDADYNSILVVMGGMSVGVGIALKDTIENLSCSVSLMLGRLRVGDMVECDGTRGRVVNIGYRTTTLETLNGSVVCFQNSKLFNQNFRNLTSNHQYEYANVEIGIANGTDVAMARRIILRALRHLPGLAEQRPSVVTLSQFGNSTVVLNVGVWVAVNSKALVLSRVREAIYKAFKDNEIEIPLSQKELYIK
ncbi:MAG: mechanosensitive ion channel [Akkermansia sp.]|nr:mechanosensitive ion channel [Akkermansia sp.]